MVLLHQLSIQIKKWSKNLSNDFNASKIFILPSLYEGCPNILVDAIMHKIPCISSNCSGASDILKNNKAGLIFPINNKKILINHIFKNSYSININVVKETRIKWNLNWYLVWTLSYTRISNYRM